jgi:hypothetical protein
VAALSRRAFLGGSAALGLAGLSLRLARGQGGVTTADAGERARLEADPATWLRALFPSHVRAPFAQHHQDFWRHIWTIEPGVRPAPYVLILPRGGAKSTSVELACAAIAARRQRAYALYVCGTQEQADDHVGNVASLLEARELERLYPEAARPLKGRYGNSRGWRRNRLRTASGFTLDAIGLDTAARGVKIEEDRPGLIILDDIDGELDSPGTVERKIAALTRKLLPAEASDCAVIAIQNLVHHQGVFARLADGRADFLLDRIVTGPIPAVQGLTVEQRDGRWVITGGAPTWAGQDLAVCQQQINTWGLTAFLREAQHEVDDPDGGLFGHLVWQRVAAAAVPDLVRTVVWVDPAVTDTDDSDACGIQADGLGADGTIYRLWSWEDRAGPEAVMLRAIAKAVELGAEAVGVETDQGGDTWKSSYARAWESYCRTRGLDPAATRPPAFRSAKAGAGHGPKVHRASQMLADYERGGLVHVLGTHLTLERALRRFPKAKPFDLTDAAYWAWADLRERLAAPKVAPSGSTARSKWRF